MWHDGRFGEGRSNFLLEAPAPAVIPLRISAPPWPGGDDRTRSAVDAVLGGLRAGCGQPGGADREHADRAARVEIRPSWSPRRSGRSRR
ncbi:hypothetical protein E3E14_11860 [Streptomyces sp. ICN441]|nr:hypothetical protein E3E14_11860 [Streptomyces sp. ICN441]